jgi:hypothetical protein
MVVEERKHHGLWFWPGSHTCGMGSNRAHLLRNIDMILVPGPHVLESASHRGYVGVQRAVQQFKRIQAINLEAIDIDDE